MGTKHQPEGRTEKIRWIVSLATVAIILSVGCILCLAKQPEEISISERRKLAQFPEFSWEALVDGDWIADFEDYTLDQFPFRDGMRSVKAFVQQNIFLQRDNNDVYVVDGNVSKLDYPLNEDSVVKAADKFDSLYEKYMADSDVKLYMSVIPDKNYFMAEPNGYPSIDYGRMIEVLRENTDITYIDIFPYLELGDYYRTDSHWSQEKLLDVAEVIAEGMGAADRLSGEYEMRELSPFYGVYYGQSALSLAPDTIYYLTNEVIENCTTYNAETGEMTVVYDEKKFSNMDPYDVFLSGAVPLLTITNPAGEKGRELIVFRDSFGSSLVPLWIEAYEKITLVDIRYMRSELIPQYIEFTDQDVLFLYSTMLLNSSNLLR